MLSFTAGSRDGPQPALLEDIQAGERADQDPPLAVDRQRPDPFASALRAAKRELDPRGILNPGVLMDPLRD